jgi:NADPH-ferrihemoprotein reductase
VFLKLSSVLFEFFECKTFTMAMFSSIESSSLIGVESILEHIQKDDALFLALVILSGIFYNFYVRDKPDPYRHVWFEKPQQTDFNRKGPETRDIGLRLEESVSLRSHFLS